MWTVATTSVDGLRCIGDGHYNTIALCSLRQYSVARPTLQLPFKPSNPSRLSTNSYPTTANHPNPSCGNYPFQPIKLSTPSIPPSPTNPFHFSGKHHTVTYKPFPLFEFPCSQHVITQRTFQFPDLISVYSSSISGPRISPKPCPSTSRTTNTLRCKSLQDNWTTSSLSSTTPSYIIIMDMCRSWANESLQKINDTGVIIKKYMLSSTITVSLWWYMGSWFLRSVRCSRRA